MFPREKYKYFTNNTDLVIAEQTYAGKKYRGKAHLGHGDEFDLEKGKDLAAARCDLKICVKRLEAARGKCDLFADLVKCVNDEYSEAKEFESDASREVNEAVKRLYKLEKELGLYTE